VSYLVPVNFSSQPRKSVALQVGPTFKKTHKTHKISMGQIWVITEKCDGQLVYNNNAKLCDRLLGRSPSTLIQWQGLQSVGFLW